MNLTNATKIDDLAKVTKDPAMNPNLPDPYSRGIVNKQNRCLDLDPEWLRINTIDMADYKKAHAWMLNVTQMVNSIPKMIPSTSPLLDLDALALLISEGIIDHVEYYGPNATVLSVYFNATEKAQAAVNIKARLEVILGGSLSDPAGKIAAQLKSVVGPMVAVSVAASNSQDRTIVPPRDLKTIQTHGAPPPATKSGDGHSH